MAQHTIDQTQVIHTKPSALSYKEKTLVMGILNVTPDSFSDGGKYDSLDKALLHAKEMIDDGAHIIDIGGESTRPGAECVSEDEEMSRVIPVIERITKELGVPISVDTYKASVADEAVKAGASIINDIWEPNMIRRWLPLQLNIMFQLYSCITALKETTMTYCRICCRT